jgi:hypothetical protein
MKVLLHTLAIVLVCSVAATAQTSGDLQHFAKDGLLFDYPSGWQVKDQSTAQIQIIQLLRGDGYSEIRVRVPREWLKSPQKEAEAKRLVQDKYIEQFVDSLQQGGLKPTRSNVTTEIAGGTADGMQIRAILGGEPGGMDSFFRVVSDRFVQLSQLGSQSDMAKSVAAWDLLRSSIKVDPPPQPKTSPPAKKP